MAPPEPRKFPVVLLHGVGLDRSMWDPVLEEWNEPASALDLPGHGAEPALEVPQTLASLSDQMRSRLPEGRVHLVGFSLGALIAQYIARFHPERVETLTCVSSVCNRTPTESIAVEKRLVSAKTEFKDSVNASLQRWYPEGTAVSQGIIDATRRTLLANNLSSYLHAYAVFARGDHEIYPELRHITTRTLAITGEFDTGSTPDMSYRIAQAIPDTRVVIVPGARHMLPVENAPAFTEALASFLAGSEGNHRG